MFLSVMKRTVLFFTVSQSNAEVCEVDDSEFWSDDGDSKKDNNTRNCVDTGRCFKCGQWDLSQTILIILASQDDNLLILYGTNLVQQ